MIHAFLNLNKAVPLLDPGSATTGALDSDWVGLKHGRGVAFQVVVTDGRAGADDDNTLTFRQATAADGTGAKAIVPRRAYRRAGATLAAAAAATPTVIEQDDDGAIDIHIDGDVYTIVDVEFDAAELDVNARPTGFAYLQARLAAVGSSMTTVSMTATVCGLRQNLAPEHQADVLA